MRRLAKHLGWRFPSLLAGCLLLCASPARSAAISMDYFLGFQGYFRLQTWSPLTVVLENRGQPLKGVVEVIVTSGSEYRGDISHTTYAAEVELPSHSPKLCALTIFITSFTHDVLLRLKHADTNEILQTHQINLRSSYTMQPFALVVAEKITPDFLSILPKALFPVSVRPRYLPETAHGYEGVSMLIITADQFRALRARQFQALTAWIQQGGYLVTASGMNYGVLSGSRIQQLLPIQVTGHRMMTELRSLEAFCGQSLISPDPFLTLSASVPNGETLAQEQDIPLIIQTSIGRGKALFLAFDFRSPPFTRWTGRGRFWEQVFALHTSRLTPPALEIDETLLLETLLANLPIHFPDVKQALLFLGIYVLLLRMLFTQLTTHHAIRWKYGCALTALIAIFSLFSYWGFARPLRKKAFSANSLLHLHHSGQRTMAFGSYLLGVYALKDTSYDLTFHPDSYPFHRLLRDDARRDNQNTYVVYEEPAGQRIHGTLRRWSYDVFTIRTPLELPLEAQARLTEHDLHVAVNNMTPNRILRCWGYIDEHLVPLENIMPNQEHQERIPRTAFYDRAQALRRGTDLFFQQTGTDKFMSFLKTPPRKLMRQLLRSFSSEAEQHPETLYLFGWIPNGILRPTASTPEIHEQGVVLFTMEVPLTREFDSSKPRLHRENGQM